MSSFEGKNIQRQNEALSYRTDLYFRYYKIVIEVDENGDTNRNIDYGIKR